MQNIPHFIIGDSRMELLEIVYQDIMAIIFLPKMMNNDEWGLSCAQEFKRMVVQ